MRSIRRGQAAGLTVLDDVLLTVQAPWPACMAWSPCWRPGAEFPWVERETLIAAHIVMLRRGALK